MSDPDPHPDSHAEPQSDALSYLLIGHIAHDRTPAGPKVGGTVSYAGATVAALGGQPCLITSILANDPVLAMLPSALTVANVSTEQSTVFINTYTSTAGVNGSQRHQVMPSRAAVLTCEAVAAIMPSSWQSVQIVHLAPLCDEVDFRTLELFPDALHVATAQGWMRAWDDHNVIRPKMWADAEALLPHLDAVVFSEEDIHHNIALEAAYGAQARLLVVTRGDQGCTLYQHGHHLIDLAAPRVEVVDPTGAGDVFAAVFFVMLARRYEPIRAATIATWLASQSVTRVGIAGTPLPDEIRAANQLTMNQ